MNADERQVSSGPVPGVAARWRDLAARNPALGRAVRLTRLAMGIERLVPALLPPLGVILAFLLASYLGLWVQLPPAGRIAGVVLFGLALLASLWPLVGWRLPGLEEVGRRLDGRSPVLHRPVETLTDSVSGSDPVAARLWALHQQRALEAAARLKADAPQTDIARRDPVAMRFALVAALAVAAVLAGDERQSRLAEAFAWSTPVPPPPPRRLDAWLDPPSYTGRPPVLLSGVADGETVTAPVGSSLVIRVTPGDGIAVTVPEGFEPVTAEAGAQTGARAVPAASGPQATFESRHVVKSAGQVSVTLGSETLARYQIALIPDGAPRVELVGLERDERETGLKILYRLEDDYGIAKAETVITRADGRNGRTLVPPPGATLGMRLGDGETMMPTEDHAWAGQRIRLKLQVSDDMGQSAESEPREAVLPQRRFTVPLAKALVEQRRALVFQPDDKGLVETALSGLLFAPELFTPKPGDFIALDLVRLKVRNARTDDEMRAAADAIYELALAIEAGDLTEAERRLREAQDRLAEALDRNASPDEIKRLTEELRRAMNEFLREFAERAQREQDQADNQNNDGRQERMLSQRDLQDMLRRIEELSRSGNHEEAQRLLRELSEMMRNLRSARRQDPRNREMSEMMDEIDRLQREQQELRDRTFQDNQRRQRQGQRSQRGDQQQQGQRGQRGQRGQQGQQGEQGEQGEGGEEGGEGQGLEQQQRALRERLNRLRERLRQRGMEQGEGFGQADEGMGDAEGQLGQGQSGRATDGQQRAIDGLGRAMQGMNEQMQREMGEGGEDYDNGPGYGRPGETQRGRAESTTDPLGRPMPQRRDALDNSRVRIPQRGESQGTLNERAQRVLEELRRKLGEFDRPREELDYFDRLLRRTQ